MFIKEINQMKKNKVQLIHFNVFNLWTAYKAVLKEVCLLICYFVGKELTQLWKRVTS